MQMQNSNTNVDTREAKESPAPIEMVADHFSLINPGSPSESECWYHGIKSFTEKVAVRLISKQSEGGCQPQEAAQRCRDSRLSLISFCLLQYCPALQNYITIQ